MEGLHNAFRVLGHETKCLKELQGLRGVPMIYWEGNEGDFHVLVMELLGPNLRQLWNACGRRFTQKTTMLIAL